MFGNRAAWTLYRSSRQNVATRPVTLKKDASHTPVGFHVAKERGVVASRTTCVCYTRPERLDTQRIRPHQDVC